MTGGHLGAGLGVVELTVAIHYVFDTPSDKVIWDVGHQAYPHRSSPAAATAFGLSAGRRAQRLHQKVGERVRSVRGGAQLDVDLGGTWLCDCEQAVGLRRAARLR